MVTIAPHLPCHLIEWYQEDLTAGSVDHVAARLNAVTAEMAAEGTPVQLLVTISVPTDEVVYGLFAASTPDTVIDVCRRAGIPAHRLSVAVGVRIDQPR